MYQALYQTLAPGSYPARRTCKETNTILLFQGPAQHIRVPYLKSRPAAQFFHRYQTILFFDELQYLQFCGGYAHAFTNNL